MSVVVTRGSTWQLSPWWWEKMHARCLIPDIIIRHMGMKNQAKVWYEPNKYEDHHIWIYGILWDIQYIYISVIIYFYTCINNNILWVSFTTSRSFGTREKPTKNVIQSRLIWSYLSWLMRVKTWSTFPSGKPPFLMGKSTISMAIFQFASW